MKHAEVLTVGNSAQPPPTGTSDGSIDLGVGLKTNPLSTLPSPSSLSPSLPCFGRAPRLEDPSPSPCPPPFFYLLFHRGNFGPKVDQLSRYCFIPFPLPSPFRVFTGAPVGSRYYCVFLPPSLPRRESFPFLLCAPLRFFDGFVSLLSRDVSSYLGTRNLKGLFFSFSLSLFKPGNLRPCLSERRFLGRVGGKCRFSTMRYFEYLYGMY